MQEGVANMGEIWSKKNGDGKTEALEECLTNHGSPLCIWPLIENFHLQAVDYLFW